ncbi:MAG: hypothetical protein LBN40_00545 [Oscillospiraceae bacterium]|jgi:amino acid permease|nr:hypothetical protein [Oscillospiraceae bacterium]
MAQKKRKNSNYTAASRVGSAPKKQTTAETKPKFEHEQELDENNKRIKHPVKTSTKVRYFGSLVCALILTAGFLVLLWWGFSIGFTQTAVLSLFGAIVVMIGIWSFYYVSRVKYLEQLYPPKFNRKGKGNRKNRRKDTDIFK